MTITPGPIHVCECGTAYIPERGWSAQGCQRCVAIDSRRVGPPRAPFVDLKTERRRSQWRAYKARVRDRGNRENA